MADSDEIIRVFRAKRTAPVQKSPSWRNVAKQGRNPFVVTPFSVPKNLQAGIPFPKPLTFTQSRHNPPQMFMLSVFPWKP